MPSVEIDLKKRIRNYGLKVKDIADSIRKPYGTLANWLNGFSPLPDDMRKKIEHIIQEKGKLQND